MKKEIDLEIICRLGLGPIYTKAEILKKELSYKYCMGILEMVGEWENHYRNAERSFRRSNFYGQWIIEEDLSDIDKIVFFWKNIADNIKQGSKSFYDAFPEEYHKYSEDNFKRLIKWLYDQQWLCRNMQVLQNDDVEKIVTQLFPQKENNI